MVREASWRTIGQRHFDVQLMGGMALHFGWIAEMKTGEGKTLVSTLPVYLNALEGRGVHVVTVNDYLATRDAGWMGQLHRFLGLTVGRIGPDIDGPGREEGRLRLRRHLRDQHRVRVRLPPRQHGPVGRVRWSSGATSSRIVDEVDSILIDEARTPLIISGPADEAAKLYYQFASVVRLLDRDDRLRGRRGEEDRRPARVGHREGREAAQRLQPLRRGRRSTTSTS